MTTLIERVIAANKRAWDEWPEPITFDNLPQVREAAARASIAAMREPTEVMGEAGDSLSDLAPSWLRWKYMIDAALEEKP